VALGATCAFPHNEWVNSEFIAPVSPQPRSGLARRLSGRHPAFLLLVVSLAAVLAAWATAKTRPSPSISTRSDPGYISALAAVNRFLQAWQNQDHETGLLMLTDKAKQNSSQDRLKLFFSSGSGTAYEIARGRKLKAGCYAFPITLFAFYSGTNESNRRHRSKIVVVRTGKDEWAIDKLP
jgi:hypothetical protein